MTFSRWDEPDWYGDKAKYDREESLRRAQRRGFRRGVLLILILLGASGAIILNNATHSGQTPATVTTNPVHFAPVTTIDPLKQAQDDLTRTAIYALAFATPTVTPTLQPSATASPSAQPPKPSLVVEYNFDPGRSPAFTVVRTLPIQAEPGYHFTGAKVGPNDNLYVAHTRGLSLEQGDITCDSQEGYWIVEPNSGTLSAYLSDPVMVGPKRIAFDSRGNAYVLAIDCQRKMNALFKFDLAGHLVDAFTLVGGDDVAINADGRIFVALSDFADANGIQPHLLELTSDPANGKLREMAERYVNDAPGGHFSTLAFALDGTLYAVWAESDAPDRYLSIAIETNATGTPSTPVSLTTFDSLSGGTQLTLLPARSAVEVDSMTLIGSSALGLDSINNWLGMWQGDGYVRAFPIPEVHADSIVLDPNTGNWFAAGSLLN